VLGGAHGHNIAIKHHKGKPAIALQRELMVKVDDRILFPLLEPVITGNEDVVFVGLTVAIPPLIILGAGEFYPAHRAQQADLGADREPLDKVDPAAAGRVSWATQRSLSPPQALFLCVPVPQELRKAPRCCF
jgi:hypothetical protein